MRKTEQMTGCKGRQIAFGLVPAFLGAFLAFAPSPAAAQIPVIDNALIAQERSVWNPLTGTFIWLFNKRMDDLSAAITNSAAGQAKTATVAAQANVNQVQTTKKAELQAIASVTKATTSEAKNAICSQVLAMQIDAIGEMWRDTLADFLDNTTYTFGGTSFCRGPWAGHGPNAANCSGASAIKEYNDARCNVATGSSVDDGTDASCVSSNKNLWGLDKSPMRAIFGANVRKMFAAPTTSSKGDKDKAHGTKEAAQNYFRAAVNACYNLYGFPSTRPHNIKSPEEKYAAVQAETVESNRKGALRECLRNLADNTIPPSEGDGKLVEAHKKMKEKCENARARKLDVSKYGDCKLGITPAESREITARLCTTTSQYKALAGTTNGSEKDISAAALACVGVSHNNLSDSAKRQSDFANVVASMAGK